MLTPGISTDLKINIENEIYVNSEWDGYDGDLLLPDQEKSGAFVSVRMLPPGDNKFYFSAENQTIIAHDLQIWEGVLETEKLCLKSYNIVESVPQNKAVYNKAYFSELKCMPRPPPKALQRKERVKTPWDFFNSVYKDYKPDNNKLIAEIFEIDWSCCKIPKLIKDQEELEKVKAFLKSKYKYFREAYKFLGGISPAGLYPSIGSNTVTDLVSQWNEIVDNQTLNLSDIDLEFVATNAGVKNNPRNPERQLVRYQLMEFFVRIAKTKFVKSKIWENMAQAVEKIYNEHLKDVLEKYDCHKWRLNHLWNEHWDYVFKRYLHAIKKIYDKYSGKYAMPGAPRYMSSDEFYDLIDVIGIVDDNFGQREIGPIFTCSMMTQKNELDNDRHINMTFIEFIEAIGRLAEKVNLPIPYEYMEYMLEEIVDDYPHLKDNPPIHYRLESLIVAMIKATLSKDFRDNLIKTMEAKYKAEYNAPKRTKYAHIDGPY